MQSINHPFTRSPTTTYTENPLASYADVLTNGDLTEIHLDCSEADLTYRRTSSSQPPQISNNKNNNGTLQPFCRGASTFSYHTSDTMTDNLHEANNDAIRAVAAAARELGERNGFHDGDEVENSECEDTSSDDDVAAMQPTVVAAPITNGNGRGSVAGMDLNGTYHASATSPVKTVLRGTGALSRTATPSSLRAVTAVVDAQTTSNGQNRRLKFLGVPPTPRGEEEGEEERSCTKIYPARPNGRNIAAMLDDSCTSIAESGANCNSSTINDPYAATLNSTQDPISYPSFLSPNNKDSTERSDHIDDEEDGDDQIVYEDSHTPRRLQTTVRLLGEDDAAVEVSSGTSEASHTTPPHQRRQGGSLPLVPRLATANFQALKNSLWVRIDNAVSFFASAFPSLVSSTTVNSSYRRSSTATNNTTSLASPSSMRQGSQFIFGNTSSSTLTSGAVSPVTFQHLRRRLQRVLRLYEENDVYGAYHHARILISELDRRVAVTSPEVVLTKTAHHIMACCEVFLIQQRPEGGADGGSAAPESTITLDTTNHVVALLQTSNMMPDPVTLLPFYLGLIEVYELLEESETVVEYIHRTFKLHSRRLSVEDATRMLAILCDQGLYSAAWEHASSPPFYGKISRDAPAEVQMLFVRIRAGLSSTAPMLLSPRRNSCGSAIDMPERVPGLMRSISPTSPLLGSCNTSSANFTPLRQHSSLMAPMMVLPTSSLPAAAVPPSPSRSPRSPNYPDHSGQTPLHS
eukprot:PhM_4_TR10524/c0_g1_i1/m.77909